MYLDRIIDSKRRSWAQGASPAPPPGPRSRAAMPGRLRDALRGDRVAVIAEVKPRSPSKGALWPLEEAVPLARTYAAGGASAVSVLADAEFFGGSPELVAAVAADAAVGIPVLYKDIVVDARQVELAHASGADGVLVIVRALDDEELRDVTSAARDLGLDPLHECFTESDLGRALALDANLVGVNNRDLQSFAVDLDAGRRLRALVPDGVVTVSESGLANAADVAYVGRCGFDACLVGEALLTSADVHAAVRAMSAVPRPAVALT
jgi:indole-3-glycerol phosphate synthase